MKIIEQIDSTEFEECYMKINEEAELVKSISESLAEAQAILNNFETNNLEYCAKVSHAIVKLYEVRENSSIHINNKDNYKKLVDYFNSTYSNHICLVLKQELNEFSYTRNNVTKFLRGAWVHTDGKREKKLELLKNFVYEKGDVEALFCISNSFIYFPCSLRYEDENTDSLRPIHDPIKRVDGQEVALTIIESVLINICHEVSSLLKYGELKWNKPILFLESIDHYVSNETIKQNILLQSQEWQSFFCSEAVIQEDS